VSGTAGRRGFGFFRLRRGAGFGTVATGLLAAGLAFGSPTSAPSGGGSGARSSPGRSRSPIRPTATIAAARATPRHLIRTPAIPRQGADRHVFSPAHRSEFAEIGG
jgi:hypothetical protein